MVSLMTKAKRIIVVNIFLGFQKSGTKSRGVLHFVPLRRFYDVLFVPLFCHPREKCGILWKTTWLHNVDNIRQKDIKCILYKSRLFAAVKISVHCALCNVHIIPARSPILYKFIWFLLSAASLLASIDLLGAIQQTLDRVASFDSVKTKG